MKPSAIVFRLCFSFLSIAPIGFANAQQVDPGPSSFSLDLFAADGAGLSVGYNYGWKFGKRERIQVGAGLRYTAFFGKDLFYITAPARLTSGKTGPTVLFTNNIQQNIDSFLVQRAQTHSVNLALALGYQFSPKWLAEFDIDLIGFSFGPQIENGLYIHEGNQGGSLANQTAKPSTFNALLISDNDRGSLYSSIAIHYRLNTGIAIKAGAAFVFSEYTTAQPVQQLPEANDRFRYKSLSPMIGLSWFLKKR